MAYRTTLSIVVRTVRPEPLYGTYRYLHSLVDSSVRGLNSDNFFWRQRPEMGNSHPKNKTGRQVVVQVSEGGLE